MIDTISKAEISQLAKEFLSVDKLAIVVAGDKGRVLPQLEKLGYPKVNLTVYGFPM